MSIIRKVRRTSYTVVDNGALNDERLSWRATGLLAYLLSLPDGWRVNHADLSRRKRDGKDATLAALRELVDAGYIERRQEHDRRGRITTVTVVYEEPVGLTLELADSPDAGGPDAVQPDSGFGGGIVSTESKYSGSKYSGSSTTSAGSHPSLGFAEFWEIYPRKLSKGTAERAYAKARKSATHSEIVAGLRLVVEREWSRREPDKVPYAATWLNACGWEDEPTATGATRLDDSLEARIARGNAAMGVE